MILLTLLAFGLAPTPDSLARDVAVDALLEPGPPYVLTVGDTLTPRAFIRNHGTEALRNVNVRLSIDPVYDRTLVIPSLAPGVGLEVRFEPWPAAAGDFAVSCSTQLDGDENPSNDRRVVTIRVTHPPTFFVEPDQSDRITAGATRSYRFHVDMRGDTGDTIYLLPVAAPPGWQARYYDSTDAAPLAGTDRVRLGYIAPDRRRAFNLRVTVPAALADTGLVAVRRLAVRAVAVGDSGARDSALLTLTLDPGLQVHNYPNPFATSTTFIIGLSGDATVSLAVYDRTGTLIRRLIDREFRTGPTVFELPWNGTNTQGRLVAPATYQYLLEVTRGDHTDRIRKHLVLNRGTE
ncbi:MAG: CARDB domain-containing protein [bacterium]